MFLELGKLSNLPSLTHLAMESCGLSESNIRSFGKTELFKQLGEINFLKNKLESIERTVIYKKKFFFV